MGQSWDLFNVDRREKEHAGGAKLGEFFFEDLTQLYESLRVPRLPKAVDKWLSCGTVVVQPGPLGKLSTEVLDMVFETLLDNVDQDHVDNFLDCIFLAIGCRRLLSVGKRHILRGLISMHARSADCRLVCLGDSAYGDDSAPPGMLTDAEIKEIATTPGPDEDDYASVEKAIASVRRLYIFALESYESYPATSWARFLTLREFVHDLFTTRRADRTSLDELYAARDPEMVAALGAVDSYTPKLEYPEGPCVLCNTSKGEYVREDTLVVWEMGSEWQRVTLAHALLSRICYSPDRSISMCCGKEYIDGLVKGPWAGDRFRITSADEMPPLNGGKKWKDVTEEVNALLVHLLAYEFPKEDGKDGEANGASGEEVKEAK